LKCLRKLNISGNYTHKIPGVFAIFPEIQIEWGNYCDYFIDNSVCLMEKNQIDMKVFRSIIADHGYADFALYKKAVEKTNYAP